MTVPACLNPLMLAMGGDPLDELGKIERAVRFRAAATACLRRVYGVSTNPNIFSFSIWVKRTSLVAGQTLLSGGDHGGGSPGSTMFFNAQNAIEFANSTGAGNYTSYPFSQVFRDTSAWLHVFLNQNFDKTKVWCNGKQIIDATTINMLLNASSIQHDINLGGIGCFVYGDQCIAQPCLVDGAEVTPTTFGQFNPRTGQWRPKSKAAIRSAVKAAGGSVRNGWGANGFFLPFDDISSVAALGYDRSQSDADTTGNNWTASNISLTPGPTYDSMLDTPTNNYATLNALNSYGGSYPLSAGNLDYVNAASAWISAVATQTSDTAVIEGEFSSTSISTGHAIMPGLVPASFNAIGSNVNPGGAGTNSYGYYPDGLKYSNGATSAYGASYTSGDVITARFDPVARTLEFLKNGVSQGIAFTAIPAGTWFLAVGVYASNVSANFGQRPLITGAKPMLCTKNLPFPRVPKSTNAFVAVTDTGANIAATLAAAESWANYIRIIKRRDAAEGWRWIFSEDAANYLDSSSSGAKAAVPSFSGTAYVGYSLKVSAANGVATGRLTHVVGTADVVPDGLANARKLVILKNEGTGTWFVYHPDLTAGKLLYLEQTAAETTDATISTVTASGFTVAAALASGTYRWIALAEVDGFLKLIKHVGNGIADGVFDNYGFDPAFRLVKNVIGTNAGSDSHVVLDRARNPSNPAQTALLMNSNAGEDTSSSAFAVDLVSNGAKVRNTNTSENNSGNTYVELAIAAFPFRYANAR